MINNHPYHKELVSLLAINNELSRTKSFNQLCRRGVELAHDRLGFDRIGIWFKGKNPAEIFGSFGIDENGKIRDERGTKGYFNTDEIKHEIRTLLSSKVYQKKGILRNNLGAVVGKGEWACAVLWCGKKSIGYITVDNLLSQKPINTRLLILYASTFGHLCSLKKTQEALQKSEERFRELWENAPVAYHTLDTNGIITDVNKTEAAMFGYKQKEMISHSIFDFIVPQQRREAKKRFLRKIAGKSLSEARNRTYLRKNGTPIMVSIEDKLDRDASGQIIGMRTTLTDITNQKKEEEVIRRLAYNDTLTGLPNRILFNEHLDYEMARAVRRKQKFAVMLLDLDYFKRINDTLGHGTGDRLLKHVGERLVSLLRKSDTVSRMSGDEFLLLLPEMENAKNAQAIARKIIITMAEPFSFNGYVLHITASIGIALYPRDGLDAETLIKNADTAMYAAKKTRNAWKRFDKSAKSKIPGQKLRN
ncbi:MAG: sensor domain-containing diguanylate cyclase [Candidatus Ratteibacteria bacterium]|jgi:diguanylate cyclase (GGDEF)-like protein/PAS domain S-box-containing protein